MPLFREIPPTAGIPISAQDMLSWFSYRGKRDYLAEDLKKYLQTDYVKITYSGTVALYIILETLKQLSAKRTVVIPAYVCPLVPLAALRAGLKVEVCDIKKESFDFDLAELEKICSDNRDILAVIPVHLAGIPVELENLKSLTEKHGIFMIEDCAQSLGATRDGKKSGTLGDFSFFSFCRGKGLTIYEGGAIVARKKEHAALVEANVHELVKNNFFSESLKLLEIIGYWIFYRPRLFWFVFRLPQIFWSALRKRFKAAAEEYSIYFSIHAVSGLRKWIGHAVFPRLEDEIFRQRQKVTGYLDRLKGIPGVRAIEEPPESRATYPYLTLIFTDPLDKQKVLKALENSGLGISQIYLCAINDYDYLKLGLPERAFPNARDLAERELTLSTSAFLIESDLDAIIGKIKSLLL